MAGCNCIDVSEHNGNINWATLKYKVDFVVMTTNLETKEKPYHPCTEIYRDA